MKVVFMASFGLVTLTSSLLAADEKPAAFKDDKEKASYAIGMSIGKNLQRGGLDVDIDVLASALKDVQAGKDGKMNDKEAQDAIRSYQMESQKKVAEKNKKAGEDFLAANKKKEGVKTHEVKLPDGTMAEMQYKVITQGSGAIPKSNDVVSVNYRGTLTDGKEFDNSAKRGGPMKRPITGFVRGWTEALEMMPVGSKWELYLPASLAYGDMGNRMSNPPIEPGSALIFEMELMSTEAPAPPAPPQPLTSDIIKVPSAEELKKGAKIEVIKPEEAAKLAAAQTNQTNHAAPSPK
jgi:FKBP-type peptidyl-prolyl cis-trans isomerase